MNNTAIGAAYFSYYDISVVEKEKGKTREASEQSETGRGKGKNRNSRLSISSNTRNTFYGTWCLSHCCVLFCIKTSFL